MKNWRINLILLLFFVVSSVIVIKLVNLQITNKGFYQAQALGQQRQISEIKPQRGKVFFRDEEELLATNKFTYSVYISPQEVSEEEGVFQLLSEVFEIKEDLKSELKDKRGWFLIKKDITQGEFLDFEHLKLKGVYFIRELQRYYPQENLGSHIIGFLGGEGRGQYGIEGYYDDLLRGEEGIEQIERGVRQNLFFFDSKIIKPMRAGSDLVLTLDYNIQLMAETFLREGVEKNRTEGGEIIIVDPYSGEILALSVLPDFNPNKYFQVKNLEIFQNSAIQKIFEPGSIFKPFTFAIALNEGRVGPETVFTDRGFVQVGARTIHNYNERVWGDRTIAQALENSINTGAVFVQSRLENEIFWDYFQRFGLVSPTGIDLHGEVFSENLTLKNGREINYVTASFGQGIDMTSLQLVRAFSAIANGGKMVKPFIVKKIILDGNVIETTPLVSSESLLSSYAHNDLVNMLINVVENGTGQRTKISGYYIAGKTGTAQVPYTSLGVQKAGYSEKTIQSFIGFAPALEPKFLIFVKLYNPAVREASISAVPIFQKLVSYLINYYQIPPDYEK